MKYNAPEYEKMIQQLKSIEQPHLMLFIGLYSPDKKQALSDLSTALDLKVTRLDFNDIVSKIETETFEKIDRLYDQIEDSGNILYFENGDKLCGAYTGFSHSKVKYATPQERYFLEKFGEYPGLVIIDITETDSADKTIRRAAATIVDFPLPKSPVRRMLWHLKNYSMHGYDIKTKRPERYTESASNY